jgi:hypothetical protein
MSTILLIAVILFLIFGPTLLAAFFEKRMVWPYGPVRKDEIEAQSMRAGDDQDANNYIIRFINDALEKGFEYLGCFNDAKGGKYKIVYHALVSPDKYTLAIIGGGKVFGMRVWGTWLFSKSDNEHGYYSVDKQSCIEKDISKLWHDQLVFADDFATLYEKHQKWIQTNAVSLKIYPSGNELEEHRRSRRYRIDYMEKQGYIRYLDNDKEYWKYTLLGAIKISFLGIVIGTFRHIKAGKFHAR